MEGLRPPNPPSRFPAAHRGAAGMENIIVTGTHTGLPKVNRVLRLPPGQSFGFPAARSAAMFFGI